MLKNIVLCSDGTGNSTIKNRGTNVYKLYEAVDLETPPGERAQVAFYDDGVGTGSLKIARVLGGAFGFGFARNVRGLYMQLCRVYQPGDGIYLSGAPTRCGPWPA